MNKNKAYVTLQNGRVFEGYRFGAPGDVTGELVFTTGMTGYLETLTDPSYFGQIVVQTFPLIGNYGVIKEDFESEKPWISAYIVREICDEPSNFRSRGTLAEYLKDAGVVGICGIDTRELTKIVRETGVMNARISDKPLTDKEIAELKKYKVTDAVPAVTIKEVKEYGRKNAKYTVALWDFGCKENIVRELTSRSCRVLRIPASYKAKQILDLNPDGIMLTNGPGDPAENAGIIAELKKLAGKKPIFGICLGHQLFALAMGGATGKMKYGHRGGNQPVKDLKTGRVYISSQNHGYEVLSSSIRLGEVRFVNANDNTCEGVDYDSIGAYTVQFHPEACGGPHDTAFLFDRFIENMKKAKSEKEAHHA